VAHKTIDLDGDTDTIAKKGTQAWQRIKKDRNWHDWLVVGEALIALREQAMEMAGIPKGTNHPPTGGNFNSSMGDLLQQYKLDDMDKGDRSRLIKVMENRKEIEAWYNALPLNQRLRLNHPSTVLRKWEALNKFPGAGTGKLTTLQKTEQLLQIKIEEVEELKEEMDKLKAIIKELQEDKEFAR
jgi:hypothetical protein